MTTAQARAMLCLSRGKFVTLAGKRGWQTRRTPGRHTYYLREDIEAERDGRSARPTERTPAAATTEAKQARRERDCLRCSHTFFSWGAGNRLCEPCNAYARSRRSSIE